MNYTFDELNINQWKPKIGDKLLLSMTKIDNNQWKSELHRSYGLYYKTCIDNNKVQDMLDLGWKLQKK